MDFDAWTEDSASIKTEDFRWVIGYTNEAVTRSTSMRRLTIFILIPEIKTSTASKADKNKVLARSELNLMRQLRSHRIRSKKLSPASFRPMHAPSPKVHKANHSAFSTVTC